jgi:hypothetical protein
VPLYPPRAIESDSDYPYLASPCARDHARGVNGNVRKVVSPRIVSLKTKTNMKNIAEFIDRYVAVWNQADADLRRKGVIAFWSGESVYLDSSTEDHGHNAIEASIAAASKS